MTAAQQALLLVNSFKGFIYKDGQDEIVHKMPYLAAKQCALICVEEILSLNADSYEVENNPHHYYSRSYWQSVKTEIEKL